MFFEKQIVTLDFETYYSRDYSLKNKSINVSGYVRHLDFLVHCVGVKINDQPVTWCKGSDVAYIINSIDWANSCLLAHNCAFDGFILTDRYNVVPAYYLDTLSMARALHSNAIGASLNEVAKLYKLGNKMPDVLEKTKGLRELPSEVMTQLGTYCAVDVELCYMIFNKMVQGFPKTELDLIDMTIRMFCDPVLQIDMPRVQQALIKEQHEKAETIAKAGVALEVLSSSAKFAAELQSRGLLPPQKISPTTGKATWAFSKSDLNFIELRGHQNEQIRNLVAARLAAKSTIGESRAQRFIDAGDGGRRLPVLLNYFGAHTGRWSAGNKMNLQNLKRKGELRKSILAPEGHVIVVADSAQIEARMTAWLAGDDELLELFAFGADVYKHMASQIYQVSVEEITNDQRFIGKIAVLGLGYGMGWQKFQNTLATGAMGPAVSLDDDECKRIVRMYRSARIPVTRLWEAMDLVLEKMIMKISGEYGPLKYDQEFRIWLPNGLYLQYPFLEREIDEINEVYHGYRYFDYATGARRRMGVELKKDEGKKIYGGLLTENVVQALARIVIAEQMLKISCYLKEQGDMVGGPWRRIVTMTHDEIVVVVPEEEGSATLEMMVEKMRQPPNWCKEIPLNAEGGFDVNYSK